MVKVCGDVRCGGRYESRQALFVCTFHGGVGKKDLKACECAMESTELMAVAVAAVAERRLDY